MSRVLNLSNLAGREEMTYEEFLQNQANIYGEIEQSGKNLLTTGIQPNIKPIEVLLVCFRYENTFADSLAKISQGIGVILPAMVYKQEDIHTTITTLPAITDPSLVLKVLSGINFDKYKPQVSFEKIVWSQDSVILKGIPNKDLFDLSVEITNSLKELGLEVRLPKMAHITLARFSEGINDLNRLKELVKFLKSLESFDVHNPIGIDLGKFTMTGKTIKVDTLSSFAISS